MPIPHCQCTFSSMVSAMSYRLFIISYNGQLPPLGRFFIVTMSDSSLSIFILYQKPVSANVSFVFPRLALSIRSFLLSLTIHLSWYCCLFFEWRLLLLSKSFLVLSQFLFFLQQTSHTHLRSIPSCARGMLHKVFLPKFVLAFAFRVAGLTVMLCYQFPPCLSVVLLFISLFLWIFVSSHPFNLFLQSLLCHLNAATYSWQREKHRRVSKHCNLTSPLVGFRGFDSQPSATLTCCILSVHSLHTTQNSNVLSTLALPAAFVFFQKKCFTPVFCHPCSLLECLWSQAIIHGLFARDTQLRNTSMSASFLGVHPSACQK